MKRKIESAEIALHNPTDYNDRFEFLKQIGYNQNNDFEFLGKYMNNYAQNNYILHINIANKYIDGELDNIKDIEFIQGFGNIEQIKLLRDEWIGICFKEAIENWIRTIPAGVYCPKCNRELHYEPSTATEDSYPYFCPECDENFFEVETICQKLTKTNINFAKLKNGR